jgi:hypothetical protein
LEPPPPKALSKAKAAALAALEMGIDDGERRGPTVRLPLPTYVPAKEIAPEALDDLEQSRAVAVLDVPAAAGQQVVLVPELTGAKDRLEITYRQAATIRMLVDVFPGAQVVFFGRSEETGPVVSAAAVDTTLDLDPDATRVWICPHCGNIADPMRPGRCVGGHGIPGSSAASTTDTASSQQSSTASSPEDTTEAWDS